MNKLAIIGAALLSSAVHAQTFVCGSIDCPINGNTGNSPLLPTGIDGIVVDGTTYNVAFSATQGNNFNAMQGVDAGNALGIFFNSQVIPDPVNNTTNGFWYSINGHDAYDGETVETTILKNGSTDYVNVVLGAITGGELNPFPGFNTQCMSTTTCTTWTAVSSPVKAPELDPASLAGSLTLLAGLIAVRRREH